MKPPASGVAGGRLSCGCTVGFSSQADGAPVTVRIAQKGSLCQVPSHVSGLAVYDHREAQRPATRPLPAVQPDFEDG